MEWLIEKHKLSELKPLENNPRTISEQAYGKLKEDLKLGNFKPLILDNDNIIIGGNQKYRALLELEGGDYEVNCSVPTKKLTDNERKKIIILDNKNRGIDDIDMLANEYEDILEELGYDDLLPKETDIDFDDIKSTQDREKKFKDIDVICPDCGREFKIEV